MWGLELAPAEIVGWMVLAIVKFLFVPSAMIARGVSVPFAIVVTSAGAALGVVLFFNFGKFLLRHWSEWMNRLRGSRPAKPRKVFTPGRRRLVRFRMRFGLFGLLAISGLISVPISSILAAKYYARVPGASLWLMLAFGVWSVVLTAISWLVRHGLLTAFGAGV